MSTAATKMAKSQSTANVGPAGHYQYSPAPEVSLSEVWRVVRKRRKLIAGVCAAVFALSVLVTLVMGRKYKATATVEVNRQNTDLVPLDDMRSSMTDLTNSEYGVIQQTEMKVLQSDTLLLRVVNDLKLESRPPFSNRSFLDFDSSVASEKKLPLEKAPHRRAKILKAIHKSLRIDAVPGTRLLTISFLNPDPDLSAQFVNTLIKDHKEENFELRSSATMEATDWLGKQLQGLKDQVETSQQKLVDYQKEAGILGADENHNIVMSRLENLNQQLASAEANRILAETVYHLAKSGNPELISGLVGPSLSSGTRSSIDSASSLYSLRAQQSQLKIQYAEASQKYGAAHPKLIELNAEIAESDEAIKKEVAKLASRAENDFQAAKETEDGLRASFEEEKIAANKLNDSSVQYSILKHEVDSNRELYDNLLKKLKEAGIFAGLRYSNILLLDEARTPDRPARPIIPLNLALGLGFGLVLGFGAGFAKEGMDHSITAPDQAEAVAGLPVLGTVPRWKAIGQAPSNRLKADCADSIRVIKDPGSPAAESYRFLRTSLQLLESDKKARVFMFTSALPGEGKTTTSVNCAAALASQGSRVLLIEADLRKPKLQSLLKLEASSGLSWALATPGSNLSLVSCPGLPNLSVLPAGMITHEPGNLLGSQRFRDCIQQWRNQFDYVIVDTPPILSVADALSIAPSCDAIVIVVRFAMTTRESLARVTSLLGRVPNALKGLVVNSFDPASPEFDRYYGYKFDSAQGIGYYPRGVQQ